MRRVDCAREAAAARVTPPRAMLPESRGKRRRFELPSSPPPQGTLQPASVVASPRHRAETSTSTNAAADEFAGKFRGVTRSGSNYRAVISREGRRYTIGQFVTPEQAAEAFDRASITLGGLERNFQDGRYDAEREALSDPSYTIERLRADRGYGRVVQTMSKYRGVTVDRRTGRYRAEIQRDGVCLSLGCYDDEEAAAEAFDRAILANDGPSARTNFPASKYGALAQHPQALRDFRDSLAHLKTRKDGGKSSSKYEGVRRYEHVWKSGTVTIKWRAELTIEGKKVNLGYFKTEEEAHERVVAYRKSVSAPPPVV